MTKLCKVIQVIMLTIALTACTNKASSVPEPPIMSNLGENSVNLPTANISGESTTNSISENNSAVTRTSSTTENNPIIKENPGMFDLDSKTVTLNSGYIMPINGLGTYSLTGDICFESVTSVLLSGVRLIDTAFMYSNEEEVGKAII